MDSHNSPTTKPIYITTQIIWYVLGLLEVALIARFVLKLFDANPAAGFVSFIYSATNIFVGLFNNIFHSPQIGGAVFELTTLLAMLIYWFVAWAVVKLLIMSKSISTPEAAEKLNKEDK
jgi:hypothetical protein